MRTEATIKYASNRRKILRELREKECFSVINRGKLWYDTLTSEQLEELMTWYKEWLNITDTLVIPIKPSWLNDKIDLEEVIL